MAHDCRILTLLLLGKSKGKSKLNSFVVISYELLVPIAYAVLAGASATIWSRKRLHCLPGDSD